MNDPFSTKLTCEVCQKNEALGVASSSLGAISLAYCTECLNNNAEPFGLLQGTVEMCGGLEGVAKWVLNLKTYHEGRYISVQEAMQIPWKKEEGQSIEQA